MKLWLDDERPAPIGWEWAKTYEGAVKILAGGQVQICSLDHDLGEEHYTSLQDPHGYEEKVLQQVCPTGYHVALYMVEHGISPLTLNVHSMNPVGAVAMQQLLQRARPDDFSPVTRLAPYDVGAGALDTE